MIISPQHQHLSVSSSKRKSILPPRKQRFSAKEATQNDLQSILEMSEQKYERSCYQELSRKRISRQEKIYTVLFQQGRDYLEIKKSQEMSKIENIGDLASMMQKAVNKKYNKIASDLSSQRLVISDPPKSSKQIQKQLAQSLVELRSKNQSNLHNKLKESSVCKSQLQIQQLQKQKLKDAEEFIKKMSSMNVNQRKRLKKIAKDEQKRHKYQQKAQKMQKEQEQQKKKNIMHAQFIKQKHNKDQQQKKLKQKTKQIGIFLKKFKGKQLAHYAMSMDFKKRQFQQQKRIAQIFQQRKKSQNLSLVQIRNKIPQYEQNKQERLQFQRQKQQRLSLQQAQIRSSLSKLFKSKFRPSSLQIPIDEQKEQFNRRKEKMMKILQFSQRIKRQHKPSLDPQKQFQSKQRISLEQKQRHKIKKFKDGQYVYINPQDLNPRTIGLSYLQQVKEMTSQIERKPPPQKQLKQAKLIDRSLLKTSFYNKKITITNWKDVINNKKLDQSVKKDSLDNYCQLVNQQQRKFKIQQKKSSAGRSLLIQRKIDHYELEKTQAKLALLKSLND